MSLEKTRRRREAVGTIHDIVGAMRSIAAGRIQSAQAALRSCRRYHEVVMRSLAAALAGPDEPAAPAAGEASPATLLVMTAEQPLCGPFNQNVLALAEQRWRELKQAGPVHLMIVGRRGMRHLAARGISSDEAEPAATSLHGLRDLVKRLAKTLGHRHAQSGDAVHVHYNRYRSVTEQVPTEERILPLDTDLIRRSLPQPAARHHRYLPSAALLAGLVREYAFIVLYRIAANSFAGEQAARLVATDAATRNAERMLDTLRGRERRERQHEITRQVLELIGARQANRDGVAGGCPNCSA